MNLIRVSILSFISTMIKMIAGLVISKTLAVVSGPSGLALIGQFQNFIQIALTAAKGSLDTGITKYTAEYSTDQERRKKLYSTAAQMTAISCTVVAILIILTSEYLAQKLLQSSKYSYIFSLFGFTIFLFAINSILLAIINGLQEMRIYIFANILQNIITLILTIVLIYFYNLDGALIALVTNQSIVLMVLILKIRKLKIFKIKDFIGKYDNEEGIKLIKYGVMTAVSSIVTPISNILIRDNITSKYGVEDAGYWQAIWYISAIYITIVTTSISVYYLPKLSSINDKSKMKSEIINAYKFVMPLIIIITIGIYLLKENITEILFTNEFKPILELYKWMLFGDVIKIASWLLAYIMLAKAMMKEFVLTEIIFTANFVWLAYIFQNEYGLVGVTYAYALNFIMYYIVVACITKKFWFG